MSYIGYQGGGQTSGGSYIGQAPGLGQRTAFRFVAVAGQTTFSGPDAQGYPMGYTPRLVDVYLNGRLLSEPDYTAADGSTIILGQGLSAGDELRVLAQVPFSPANTYTMAQTDAFQRRRNRIVDPGMRVSQENGNNALASSGSAGSVKYPSDSISMSTSLAAGSISTQRIALATPGGSPYRVRVTMTGVNANPAAADYALLQVVIEGADVADLAFGTAAPRKIAVRFGLRSAAAGAFPVAVLNGAQTRSWIGTVTVLPTEVGVDVVKNVVLTGDSTGSWAVDNTAGMKLFVGLCVGANLQGVAGWQSGSFVSVPGCVNLMATNGATFDLFDVGLYDVTGLTPGVIPNFELDTLATDLVKCQRYYQNGATYIYGNSYAAGWSLSTNIVVVQKRVSPSVTISAIASQSMSGPSIAVNSLSDITFYSTTTSQNALAYYSFYYNINARL